MELVRGVKITDFCNENNVSTEERLKLFMQVCQAIQHAHQKGIIHRDIKPSNILVTVNDDVPVPKVIDFGIAKATQGRLTDQTLFTAFDQFIGTPAYMSPEQAVMTSLDVDTRSDMYSLGVLLYELLVGRTPFDQKELLAAGLDEMRRTIREVEPVKPSTRLTQELVAADVTSSEIRDPKSEEKVRASSRRLLQEVRGDLDWIVMKCLEKDRTRRYETANGLTLDIHRHLDNEPIVARPPSQLYRFGKLVRRNKLAFASAAIIAVLLVGGAAISTWQAVRATRAEREQTRERAKAEANEKKAKAEAVKSQQVAQFLKDMLEGVGPAIAMGRDTTILREILDQTAERVGQDMKEQPEVEAELRTTIGVVYEELGEYEKAGANHRASLATRQRIFGDRHPDVAFSLVYLGRVLWRQGKLDEAEPALRKALAIQRELHVNEHLDVTGFMDGLSSVLWRQGKLAEAVTMQRDALAMRQRLLGAGRPDEQVAYHLDNLAAMLWTENVLDEAESKSREGLEVRISLFGNKHTQVAVSLNNLANILRDQGKLAEAAVRHREALAIRRELYHPEHPFVATSLVNLTIVLVRQGEWAQADAAIRESLSIYEKTLPRDWRTFNAQALLGSVLLGQRNHAEAEPLLLAGFEGMMQQKEKIPSDSRPRLREALQRLVQLYDETSRPAQTAEWKQKLAEFEKSEAETKAAVPKP